MTHDPPASAGEPPPENCDIAIIGAGVIGLAVARELLARNPRATVCVLEREGALASHQSSRNSGVIHAGIYYRPGSLKAHLCVSGARDLYDYCEAHEIPHARCGKLILALERGELTRLEELERRGRANGVRGLRRLGASAIESHEPHARAIAALHSPETGVVDFSLVARALAVDLRHAGAVVCTGCEVLSARPQGRVLRLSHSRGVTEAGHAVFCAGAWADRLARRTGASADPRIVPFRGVYQRLRPERDHLVRSLIYPVPDPSLPFLGVHLTRTIAGEVLVGPTALLAGGRDADSSGRLRTRDLLDTVTWPGAWRMVRRWWRTGATELLSSLSPRAFARAAARYVPALEPSDLEPAFAGIRAQAVSRDGLLLDDFLFSHTARALHVRNAPSPGATASLAIARHIADQAGRAFAGGSLA